MKRVNFLLAMFLVGSLFFLTNCGGSEATEEENVLAATSTTLVSESSTVATYFAENGDLINAAKNGFPKLISASEVNDLLGGYIQVIDLRSGKDFASGHIDGSLNLKAKNLLYYFQEDFDPTAYDQIVLVCYSGQTSSYAAGILNLMGYTNVVAMQWGMSSWNKKFMNKWQDSSSDSYIGELEIQVNEMAATTGLPEISTGMTDAKEIIDLNAKNLFDKGFAAIRVKSEDVFANLSSYYIVNYNNDDIYSLGHIVGSIQYIPKKSLGLNQSLETLPLDKPIIIYDQDGHNSAFTVAYLRMLGYDAYLMLYGANSFMHTTLIENNIRAFNVEQVNDFEFIETEFGGVEEEGGGGC